MKNYYLLVFALSLFACNPQGKPGAAKPYFFDRATLDKMVKEKRALYLQVKRADSTLQSEKFFLGDTAQYELQFDKTSKLEVVMKRNEHGMLVLTEYYYPSGQRKGLYPMSPKMEPVPQSVFEGVYFDYYEDGNIKEKGLYKNNLLIWTLPFGADGEIGDTTEKVYK
jgi:hypothetical protein